MPSLCPLSRVRSISITSTSVTVSGVPVLQDVNLHVLPGQTIALVGQTGSGKTTMTALVARLYDVTGGSIKVDGHDVRDIQHNSLARQMGVVLQDPFLFSGTVKDNIRYGRPEASDEDVEIAATAVGAHDFIMQLENGYDTVLEERGQNISLGQRQLLSFARAIAANPKIIVLDEATARVDSTTEATIQQALQRAAEGPDLFRHRSPACRPSAAPTASWRCRTAVSSRKALTPSYWP